MRGGAVFAVLLALFAGCDGESDQCACTTDYRSILVFVEASDGQPAPGLRVHRIRLSTGDTLSDGGFGPPEPGRYVVAIDSLTRFLRTGGESIRFEASGPAGQVSAEFLIGTDDCRCHVEKRGGPDTLRLVP